MSRNTPNLGLTVWDANNDTFNHAQLATNWDLIDADYTRPRSANQAEILAALPGSANFNGRLVYLSAADGGFATGTLVRYQGGSWKAIGPFEVLAAVPTLGNYAGRLVLLSAASGSFAQWSLIRYDGVSWALTNYTYEILSAVPGSGNFAGRLVMLSSASGGFNAWDLIRFDGSAWAKIGPQAIPPATRLVETSITADATTTNIVDPGDTLLTFAAATYENVQYYFHATIPATSHSIANATVNFRLRESTTNIGNIIAFDCSGTAGRKNSHTVLLPFTPTAGSHTYSVTWWSSTAGTATLNTTGLAPSVFRIVKA